MAGAERGSSRTFTGGTSFRSCFPSFQNTVECLLPVLVRRLGLLPTLPDGPFFRRCPRRFLPRWIFLRQPCSGRSTGRGTLLPTKGAFVTKYGWFDAVKLLLLLWLAKTVSVGVAM